jgi:hypothetical protein
MPKPIPLQPRSKPACTVKASPLPSGGVPLALEGVVASGLIWREGVEAVLFPFEPMAEAAASPEFLEAPSAAEPMTNSLCNTVVKTVMQLGAKAVGQPIKEDEDEDIKAKAMPGKKPRKPELSPPQLPPPPPPPPPPPRNEPPWQPEPPNPLPPPARKLPPWRQPRQPTQPQFPPPPELLRTRSRSRGREAMPMAKPMTPPRGPRQRKAGAADVDWDSEDDGGAWTWTSASDTTQQPKAAADDNLDDWGDWTSDNSAAAARPTTTS